MKVCAIGCGEHAAGFHGPSLARYAAAHPGFELTACCDLQAPRAERYRERFGFARSYTDPGTMLAAETPDAVVLVVPEPVTCTLACDVLERGLPLLLEKPPGRNLAELDRIRAAAEHGFGHPVPHQVALNRRHVPLVREARRLLDARGGPEALQHIQYEMTRVDRRDADFSATAIHGIDAVRYLAGADYASVRFRYREFPELGPGVANIFLDALMTSGATAQLAFCPVAGVVVERATLHFRDATVYVRLPMWNAYDSPGSLEHVEKGRLVLAVAGEAGAPSFVLGGFDAQNTAFFDALGAGRPPSPSLLEARESVAVAEKIQQREKEFTP
jgi:myo-inositol 2-dehydrogenase / D-chiro-inositol 1-dehydrogenase